MCIRINTLGLSRRTLQRRLAEEGYFLCELISEVKKELATELMARKDLLLEEIAFTLDFSSASAFHRAFRTWFNISPAAYRKSAF